MNHCAVVVALFNAIAKAKREELETTEASNSKESNQVKAKDVMEMSRSNFLDLLKSGGSTQETSSASSSSTLKKSSVTKKHESEDDEDDEDDGLGATSWSVLKESYLTDKKLALKVLSIISLSKA